MSHIALDIMGGDHGLGVLVRGAGIAAEAGDIDVVLVGDSESLSVADRERISDASRLTFVHAPTVVAMADRGAAVVRDTTRTSLRVAAELVRDGAAQALVSVGNTGAVMATAIGVFGRLPSILRPALGVVLPGESAAGTLLLDVGANVSVRAPHLVQFAQLGAAYMTSAGIASPRVRLLSVGEESVKGTPAVVEAHRLLTGAAKINFAGNVEGHRILDGTTDVIVTDGFTGNVVLKFAEGLASHVPWDAVEAGVVDHSGDLQGARAETLVDLRQRLRLGAVPLLGVPAIVFAGHAASGPEAVASAIRSAARAIEGDMVEAMRTALGAVRS